jgi:hypothetical protein
MLPETRAALIANPWVTLIETEHGGHCAFLAAEKNGDGRWAERTLLGFLLETCAAGEQAAGNGTRGG